MIIVTGAAGFIGSCMLQALADSNYEALVGSDNFTVERKFSNHGTKDLVHRVDRSKLYDFIEEQSGNIKAIIHLGARTDTVDSNKKIFEKLNISYSKTLWKQCTHYQIPFIYASSAATYGNGDFGFDDQMANSEMLKPLNEYGRSKQIFDVWALTQKEAPPYWVGLKFFNVYGPNEYHKARMASVIFHAFNQIRETKKMKLFRSHRPDFEDGLQLRDFIYVKDVCQTIIDLLDRNIESGIYNLGTGTARSFLDLVKGVFKALGLEPEIEFIDIPEDIRENYQYFTEAKMQKLKAQGIDCDFTSLEDGVRDYVTNYLLESINL